MKRGSPYPLNDVLFASLMQLRTLFKPSPPVLQTMAVDIDGCRIGAVNPFQVHQEAINESWTLS